MASKKNTMSTTPSRTQAVATALASVRAEGLEPSMATKRRLNQYANGAITADTLHRETVREATQTASARITR